MRFRNSLFAMLITTALAFAQRPGGGVRTYAGLNMAQQQLVEGTISSVQIAFGAQYPSIVVNKTQIKVAPVWYLLENDFELTAGEAVKVRTAPSNTANDPYLYAIEILKVSNNTSISIRNEAGVPLWIGSAGRGGGAQAPRTGGNCVDSASIQTATGTVDSVTAGVGIQHPSLVLKVNGALLTIELGPERILLSSDLEMKPGATTTVRYASATCEDEFVALVITDAEGRTLVLRHDDGTPAWND